MLTVEYYIKISKLDKKELVYYSTAVVAVIFHLRMMLPLNPSRVT